MKVLAGVDSERRFSGLDRLYGAQATQKLKEAFVVVIGVGGVGSWAAEACARSGIGHLILIDLDNIAESNINRQIHALSTTLGSPKVLEMSLRIKEINPECEVTLHEDFITEDNLEHYLAALPHDAWIIDAMDEVKVKAALIAWAKMNRRQIICSGGAGAKTDPMKLVLDDLNFSYHDPLCARLKSILKKIYHFPAKPKKMNVPIIFSTENNAQKHSGTGLNCAGFGSVVTITATMGLMMAGYVINKIVQQEIQ